MNPLPIEGNLENRMDDRSQVSQIRGRKRSRLPVTRGV